MYMYQCIYPHRCICLHIGIFSTCIHMYFQYMHTYVYICMHLYTFVYTCIHKHIYTYILIHTHTYTYIHTHTHTHTCPKKKTTYIHTYMHTQCIHIVCMYVCMCMCVCTSFHQRTRHPRPALAHRYDMYVLSMHVCMYVYVCMCMCVCTSFHQRTRHPRPALALAAKFLVWVNQVC